MSSELPRPTDNAFLGQGHQGRLSRTDLCRRAVLHAPPLQPGPFEGVDLAVWGIPFDASVSNRPGARFGPQGVQSGLGDIRRRSSISLSHLDPFETVACVDYGDCVFDYGRNGDIPGAYPGTGGRRSWPSDTHLFSIGGDHFVTYPLLKAHVAKHGPLALVQFDAHQDTWSDEGDRIDHGTFTGRAVREGLIDPERSIQIGIRTHAPETCGLEIIYRPRDGCRSASTG